MSIGQFIKVLNDAGLQFSAEDVLDAIWLAGLDVRLSLMSTSPAVQVASEESAQNEARSEQKKDASAHTRGKNRKAVNKTTRTERQLTPVYPSGDPSDTDRTVQAGPVAVPAGRALANRLDLARTLRPLRQRWPSGRDLELDETKTVETTADLRSARFQSIYPVFEPRRERWFEVDIILEDDPAIELWNETLRDFSQMLRDTGAFRQVRSLRLRL